MSPVTFMFPVDRRILFRITKVSLDAYHRLIVWHTSLYRVAAPAIDTSGKDLQRREGTMAVDNVLVITGGAGGICDIRVDGGLVGAGKHLIGVV
jgi:hypothetical protein